MNSLPDPKQFKDHKTDYVASIPKETEKTYDLEKIHSEFMEAKRVQGEKFLQPVPDSELVGEVNPSKLLYELIDLDFLKSCNNSKWFSEIVGYSPKDKSLTVHLWDSIGMIQTVAVRESLDRDGNPVKWKTFGSKKFIPYQIEDDFIFLFSGMAELLIMRSLGLNYVMLQADGMVRHLPEELKELCKEKTVIVLQDNDDSFRKIVPTIREFFSRSEVLVIDFERVLDRELKHGYDFRDFVNEIKDSKKVMERLEIEIICLQDRSYV